ncbi:aminomethyl-transferring glycine dehydrogenase [Mariniblastus fucicola]|uniref:Glycine dehydrogenase (decarboxylating) n=1 Tax=Mariniblastus fucicola TaxID=980251 RepID=A0A5B9PNG5_9BACT|nr:aminomethyl-transferring glycine dehydrogenase [Mariniblastus fucicola]QEG23803.1 Glycine dehydrogenase (decarboxylating) [Mariniblastus fucicola]
MSIADQPETHDHEHEISLDDLLQKRDFIRRHIGPRDSDLPIMLETVGASSLDDLTASTIPEDLLLENDPAFDPSESILPTPTCEHDALEELHSAASMNMPSRSFIGQGYYGTIVPNVILRNVLENPGWYTAYTPYQPEIAQGRLESLLAFQQMTIDLTGMEFANASLLDEATAAAEAMALCKRANKKNKSNKFFVSNDVFAQTIDVLKTRAQFMGIELIFGDAETVGDHEIFGALLQYPGASGKVIDLEPLIEAAHANNALVSVATDLMALVVLKAPGEMGADVVVGSAQRFGVPMGFGGPHAAFFATRDDFKRSVPGRVIGVSKDSRGKMALRMAMQTREQHIRRDKATSNICTAQALLANMSAFYAIWHGPEGLMTIASRIHFLVQLLASGIESSETLSVVHDHFFDTVVIHCGDEQAAIRQRMEQTGINLFYPTPDTISISLDESTSIDEVFLLMDLLDGVEVDEDCELEVIQKYEDAIPDSLSRTSDFLTHEIFNRFDSETEMLRYLKRLENRDFSLTHGMIPLGSCTMKLNATAEMIPVSWAEFSKMHPFVPMQDTEGYRNMIAQLEAWLIEMTGYDAMSMQPNSGAQGEYAGLLAIRRYHESLGEGHRNVCLIPSSAHGTNPASATMMGLKVVVVKTDENGNIDLDDLKAKAEQHSANLSSLMITYPSTHGVFEKTVREACELVHDHGGQVYMDGANMNAMVGLVAPGKIGSDVSHLNLHKTFCIPHGGGGPGMGPIGVKSHLAPFLSQHVVVDGEVQMDEPKFAVSAAEFGSASILPISWMFIRMMGGEGLRKATQVAILNANYIAKRLEGHYEVLYKGQNGRVAHECIVDIRPISEATGITEVDIAKRLMDYGFHAPTMSWPVAGTIMIEPTESESLEELDRFCEALISIRDEIREVESGKVSAEDSVLHHAPHTVDDLTDDNWERAYSKSQAVHPSAATKLAKFWPAVNRVDNVYGDRNLVCSCPPMEDYE